MKLLFLSDTHGNLDLINHLAKKHDAEYCFHAGDICCFDQDTIPFFTDKELMQMIRHSALSSSLELNISRAQMEEIAIKYRAYGNFYQYLCGEKRFDIPVYFVMGNREDLHIIERIRNNRIPNLTILDDHEPFFFDNFSFFGIGGTFQKVSFTRDLMPPGRIYPVISRSDLQKLTDAVDQIPPKYKRFFLTHMGPAEIPEIQLLAQRLAADYVLSGHTHHFSVQDWYCEHEKAVQQFQEKYHWQSYRHSFRKDRFTTLNFNLPKATRGYIIFETKNDETNVSFQYFDTEKR